MVIPDNQYYSIYLNLYLYLSSDGLFTCSTLTPEYWRLKLALQLNGIKGNQSPHKYALWTYFLNINSTSIALHCIIEDEPRSCFCWNMIFKLKSVVVFFSCTILKKFKGKLDFLNVQSDKTLASCMILIVLNTLYSFAYYIYTYAKHFSSLLFPLAFT